MTDKQRLAYIAQAMNAWEARGYDSKYADCVFAAIYKLTDTHNSLLWYECGDCTFPMIEGYYACLICNYDNFQDVDLGEGETRPHTRREHWLDYDAHYTALRR